MDDSYAFQTPPRKGAGTGLRRVLSNDDLDKAKDESGAPSARDGRRGGVDAGAADVLEPATGPCEVCGKATSFRCATCQDTFYCSRTHQRERWLEHKKVCNPLGTASPSLEAKGGEEEEEEQEEAKGGEEEEESKGEEKGEQEMMALHDARAADKHIAWADGSTGGASEDVPEDAAPKARRLMGLPGAGGNDADVASLVEMGFGEAAARLALAANGNQLDAAAEYLLFNMGGGEGGEGPDEGAGGIRVRGDDETSGPGVDMPGCSCLEYRSLGNCAHLPAGWEPPLPTVPSAAGSSGGPDGEVTSEAPQSAEWEARDAIYSEEPPVVAEGTAQVSEWARVSGQQVRVLARQGSHQRAPGDMTFAFLVSDVATTTHFSVVCPSADVDMLVKTHWGAAVGRDRIRTALCLVSLMEFERTAEGERRLVVVSPSGRMIASSHAVQDAGVAHTLGGDPEQWECRFCTFANLSVRNSTPCEVCGNYADATEPADTEPPPPLENVPARSTFMPGEPVPSEEIAAGDGPLPMPAADEGEAEVVVCAVCGVPADVRLGNTCRNVNCGARL